MRLRRRRFFGVTSTNSSAAMYSIARSSESLVGGVSWMPLPEPCERKLVSCFARTALHGDVLVAGVLADDHPLVDLLAGADEELAALLDHLEGVGRRVPASVAMIVPVRRVSTSPA
jgi:hypothetical protein